MHELSIVGALLDQVSREVARHAGARVRRVEVRIGEASGVESELFQRAFEGFRSGIFADTELKVTHVPSLWKCNGCQREFSSGDILFCSDCGLPGALLQGAELMLDRIELEVPSV